MPLIFPSNTLSAAGGVANSCRFNDGDSPSMTKTLGTPTSTKIGTFSCWVKLGNITTEQSMLGAYADSDNRHHIEFQADHNIEIFGKAGGSTDMNLITDAYYRDPSAGYSVVVAWDTSQGTEADRVKLYVNGTQVTSFATETYPAQDTVLQFNTDGSTIAIGRNQGGNYADGYLAEVVFIDGTQYAASDFGEFDEDSPTIWKPKDVSGLTFGDEGFYLDFEDSADLGADVSGNSNDLTLTNLAATDQATDTPTNNFATFNPLYQSTFHATSRAILAEGNTKWTGTSNSTSQNGILSTLGASKGKFYLEAKWGGTGDATIGVAKDDFGMMTAGTGGLQSAGWYGMNTNLSATGGAGIAWWSNNVATGDRGSTISSSDIIMMAIDIDNSKLYFGLNGTWEESGDPTSGATGTGATSTLASDTTYLIACANYGYSTANSFEFNFGSPAYAITSGNADADDYGNFEYAVPSGYYALCTKNLAEYG